MTIKDFDEHLSDHHCIQLVPLFFDLSPDELAQVEEIVQHKKVKKGETVIQPSAEPLLTIVAKGSLKIYQISSTGKEQLLRVIEPGGYEGEKSIFGLVNKNLFGEALSDSTICFVRKSDFTELLLAKPQLSLRLLEMNAVKQNETEQQAKFLMMESVEMRLANYLLDLAKITDGSYVQIPMTLKDLSAFIGTTPETISRKLRLLEEKGLVEHYGKSFKILDYERLEDEYA
ncbi:Crp/Fnr family transcriptional regulator [Lactococcus cremoris]|uniref:Transcriptional regulator n=4 Tax=Lactococcus lactis subsp. cremoris TaxID=1359 RepID=A0A1V0P8R0_LACLC|nr:Crp/Fnr family transcriptional regulator [Lactococcus cremoris]EQC95510.1 Crp/Fnr family transcriptional regulator [Lactococcus cremoris subsp. cremoris TIFN3]MDU1525740.1 Crp/Fnr family transcriptional regulator [Lactococcus lactis]ABJ72582.1 Crp-like transcriptional regulator [Lactococcus cremoris subsp. cremoris SK11]ARE23183.1 Crp/Fnr family transcriptional regulator [Lactococcus cremoris]EUN35307.1 transcriptional regulator Crp/Fnr family [Lactococcus cremoris subsp. cremoris HP]